MWGKFFKPGAKIQTSQAQNKKDQELLETQLKQLHYRANPQFEQNLKARLLANLAQQPGPASLKNRRWQFNLSRSVGLVLTGAVGLALAVLLISVLTVQPPGSTVSQLNSSATVAPVEQTALPSVAISPAPTAPALTTTTGQPSEAGTTTKTEVAVTVATPPGGTTPPTPGYLPADYKLQTSEVITPDEKSGQSFSGYSMRYQSASEKDKAEDGLEISRWQLPFDVKITFQATTTGMTHPGQAPTALLMGAQKVVTTTINGEAAYNLAGPRWRIQLLATNSSSQPASIEPPQAGNRPGFGGGMPMMNTSANHSSSVAFGRLPNGRNEYFIDYSWRGSPRNVQTVLWQHASVLTLVSGNTLSDEELAKVAGSIK